MVPPNLVPVTVEKVAVNAVMAGCRPEYLPVVLAAVEAAAPTSSTSTGSWPRPGSPVRWWSSTARSARAIGMNSGINALGQGNRANATIGRALQLVIRNVGGGRPGEVDRATLGTPGKYTFCFAEDEAGSPWESLAVERGFAPDASTVTVFAGGGVRGVADQLSRTPESLTRSLRRVPAGGRPSQAGAGLRRHAGRVARPRPGVPRGRAGPRPGCARSSNGLLELSRPTT